MAQKIIRGLLTAGCVIALLFAALYVWTEEVPDPLTGYYCSKEYDIDRLEIAPFSQGQTNAPVQIIQDKKIIDGYKKAFVWENSNAICCDEDTTYIFTEYNEGQAVMRTSYKSLLFSRYHNIGFRWKQFCLIHQIQPVYLWGILICVGLVIAILVSRKYRKKAAHKK